jgi:hypothetical protein
MKNTRRPKSSFSIAYCGIMSALSLVVMFIAIIPSLAYIMPAIAGLLIWTVRSQCSWKWAVLTYVGTAILSLFLVPEKEAMTFFILIFGYYPLIRELIQKVRFVPVQLILKLIVFNITAVTAFTIVVNLFIDIELVLDGLERAGEYAVYVYWVGGNIAFFLYDISLNYIIYAFDNWVKPVINKKIK